MRQCNVRNIHIRRGFTLIELLVVVAIIAVLMAILMPSLSSARTRARAVVCQANLRSLGMASLNYRQEYDDMLPAWGFVNSGYPWKAEWSWFYTLVPYISANSTMADGKAAHVPVCPEAVRPSGTSNWVTDYPYTYSITYYSSSGNNHNCWPHYTWLKGSKIANQAGMFLFGDTSYWTGFPWYIGFDTDIKMVSFRHGLQHDRMATDTWATTTPKSAYANFVFLDAHVEEMNFGYLIGHNQAKDVHDTLGYH